MPVSTTRFAIVSALAVAGVIGGAVALAMATSSSEPAAIAPAAVAPATEIPLSFSGELPGDEVLAPAAEAESDGVRYLASELREGSDAIERTLCTTVEAVNDGSSVAPYSVFDFALQDPRGAIRSHTPFGGGDYLGTGELVPAGGRVTGDICFTDHVSEPGTYVVLLEGTSGRLAWVNDR